MKLLTLFKGKLLVTVVVGVVLVGGTTGTFVATSVGQTVVQSLIQWRPTVTATATQQDSQSTGQPTQDQRSCPGLSQAQKLASKYQLSPDSQGAAVKAICALHQGTFKGTTSAGTPVIASRAYGYGEIAQLLTSAQDLASQDQTNPGGKLNDINVSSYLAAVLQSCGTAPLATCLQTPIPTGQPGNRNGQGNGHQPTATPTPHH